MPIPIAAVSLIDPLTEQEITVSWESQVDATGRLRRIRRTSSGDILKIPEKDTGFSDTEGPLDTPADVVSQVTFWPDMKTSPFPNSWMNEVYKMKRKGKEGAAL